MGCLGRPSLSAWDSDFPLILWGAGTASCLRGVSPSQTALPPVFDPVSARRLEIPPMVLVPDSWLEPISSLFLTSHLPRCETGAGVEAQLGKALGNRGLAAGTCDRRDTASTSSTSAVLLLPSPPPSFKTASFHFLSFPHLLFYFSFSSLLAVLLHLCLVSLPAVLFCPQSLPSK